MGPAAFERFAGWSAIVAGVGGLGYSAAFVTYLRNGSTGAAETASLLLLLGGLLTIVVMLGAYERVRGTDASFASLALVFGVVSGAGTAIHGAFDLANFINPPATPAGDLPNAVDPRGLLTFGMSAIAILIVSWLAIRGGRLPTRLGQLGILGAALLVVVYLGRLIVLNPKSPGLLTAAVLSGFLLVPAWYVWLGVELKRPPPA